MGRGGLPPAVVTGYRRTSSESAPKLQRRSFEQDRKREDTLVARRNIGILGLCLLGGVTGCSAADKAAGMAANDSAVSNMDSSASDAGPTNDNASSSDTAPSDSAMTDSGQMEDTGADSGPSDVRAPMSKDPAFIVPPGEAERTSLALSATHAAWVERATPNSPPQLVTWDLAAVGDPTALSVPYLKNPQELVLGDGWLFYTDDRYGDADVFGVDLGNGVEHQIVTRQGSQTRPSAAGSIVVWQDCRDCVLGDPALARPQIYRRSMPDGDESLMSDGANANWRPAFGTLADGKIALAWVVGGTEITVPALSGSWTVPEPIAGVALAKGMLAWRPSPAVINPDSMMPSDVYVTDPSTGETTQLTVHAEIRGEVDEVPVAAGGLVAWLEDVPESEPEVLRRIRAFDMGSLSEVLVVDKASISQLAISESYLGFVAPHLENGGMKDVHILNL